MPEYEKDSKGLPSDEEIINCLNEALDDNLTATQNWRQYEVRENYAMFEGNQWTRESYDRQAANAMPGITINRIAPILESICGFEIQNRLDIHYAPRLVEKDQRGFSDVVNNTVKYIEQNTKAQSQYSLSFKDMLLCGVGVTNTSINYDNNQDGEVEVRRVFPAFVFWDITARAKNIVDANYVIEVKVQTKDLIAKEYGITDPEDIYSTSTIDARIIQFFETVLAVETLGVVYEYQWRQKESFYRVENPFKEININQYGEIETQAIIALLQQMSLKYNFDPRLDSMFTVETKSELKDLKDIFNAIDVELEYTEQKKYCYYRAIVTGGNVIEKSENYSQTGFSLKFMTGQFSELTQSYYGLGRACKDPQRMLNQTVSDYVGFLQSIPKGGVNIESDAVSNLDAFIETYTKARNVTVFKPGTLSAGKVLPKVAPPLPQGMVEMIQYADAQIMQVCGVTPEFMGMMSSKEMNSSFLRQQIKQGLTPLSTYLDAKYTYLQRQAELYIDCVRILADNSEGRLIKNVIGESNASYVPLLKNGIAAEYDIIVDEVPASPDENKESFLKVLELQQAMPDKNLMPLILKLAPFSEKTIEELTTLTQPAPPPAPDPINQRLLASQADLNTANAHKLMSDAQIGQLEAQLKANELRFASAKETTDIQYTQAKTAAERSKAHKTKHDVLKGYVDSAITSSAELNKAQKAKHDSLKGYVDSAITLHKNKHDIANNIAKNHAANLNNFLKGNYV